MYKYYEGVFCLKIKKYFVGFVASTMLVSACYCIKPVEAIDFSKDEAKYMSLCASGKLTNSNKKTCAISKLKIRS